VQPVDRTTISFVGSQRGCSPVADDLAPRRPAFDEAALDALVRSAYGIIPTGIVFEPSGHDASTRAFRIDVAAPGRGFFLKIRPASQRLDVAGRVASHLRDSGLVEVVAPIRSRGGGIAVRAGEISVAVFPLVEGRRAMEGGLSDGQWERLGRFAHALHETTLPADLAADVPRESFRTRQVEVFSRVDAAAMAAGHATDEARDVADAWRDNRALISRVVERTATLAVDLQRRRLPLVLCHADLHTGNVLVDDAGDIWIIDWDEVVLAPRERDLMFSVGGISREMVDEAATRRFLDGYGEAVIDPVALSYYRYAWATQDVVGYAEQVFLDPTQGAADRAEAARVFRILFRPGEIVDIATSSAV
jgi:spectinomycin phosphotransferase